MPADDRFPELLNQLTHAHKVQTDAAFERGREAGRREAMREFRRKLAGLTDLFSDTSDGEDDIFAVEADAATEDGGAHDTPEAEGRAPPGSVKPIISDLIHSQPGLMTVQIREITKLKPNSIRGTLWALSAQDKAIERRDGRWYPVAQKDEAAGTAPTKEAPTASEPEGSNALFD